MLSRVPRATTSCGLRHCASRCPAACVTICVTPAREPPRTAPQTPGQASFAGRYRVMRATHVRTATGSRRTVGATTSICWAGTRARRLARALREGPFLSAVQQCPVPPRPAAEGATRSRHRLHSGWRLLLRALARRSARRGGAASSGDRPTRALPGRDRRCPARERIRGHRCARRSGRSEAGSAGPRECLRAELQLRPREARADVTGAAADPKATTRSSVVEHQIGTSSLSSWIAEALAPCTLRAPAGLAGATKARRE